MVDIEDAVRFYESYLTAEHAGSIASASEPDDVLDARRAEVMSFMYVPPGVIMSPSFGRQRGHSSAKIARMAQTMDFVRRALFLVAEYERSDGRRLFTAYVGGNQLMTAGSYSDLIFSRSVDDELKIIAFYRKDFDSVPPPVRWTYAQGVKVEDPGAPRAVRALVEPTLDGHRQDWEALRDLTSD